MDLGALCDFKAFGGVSDGVGFGVGSASLVLDGERGELVMAPARSSKKEAGGVSDWKAALALKSHSEAERRRRERINAHLGKLRSLVPCNDKLDKAALLAEVVNHVKELKNSAAKISNNCTVPSDVDEVRVEVDGDGTNNGSFSIKASFSCEDRPDLLSDLRQTLRALPLKTVGAEISCLGGRIKNVFIMTCEGHPNDFERHVFTTSVHQALKSVLDRATSPDFLPGIPFPNKRRRISPFESSCSSS